MTVAMIPITLLVSHLDSESPSFRPSIGTIYGTQVDNSTSVAVGGLDINPLHHRSKGPRIM